MKTSDFTKESTENTEFQSAIKINHPHLAITRRIC